MYNQVLLKVGCSRSYDNFVDLALYVEMLSIVDGKADLPVDYIACRRHHGTLACMIF